MVLVRWHPHFEIGIEEFDQHHMLIFQLIGEIANKTQNIDQSTEFSDCMENLLSYIKYHFGAEERWMKNSKVPDLNKHIEEHSRFINEINNNMSKLETDFGYGTMEEILDFVKMWFIGHILDFDSKISPSLKVKTN